MTWTQSTRPEGRVAYKCNNILNACVMTYYFPWHMTELLHCS